MVGVQFLTNIFVLFPSLFHIIVHLCDYSFYNSFVVSFSFFLYDYSQDEFYQVISDVKLLKFGSVEVIDGYEMIVIMYLGLGGI